MYIYTIIHLFIHYLRYPFISYSIVYIAVFHLDLLIIDIIPLLAILYL